MTVISWIKQGGRRYPQYGAPGLSAVGQAWASIGTSGAVTPTQGMMSGGASTRRRRRWGYA